MSGRLAHTLPEYTTLVIPTQEILSISLEKMKMLKIIVFAFVALLLVTVRATPLQHRLAVEVIELEEPCVRQGGICLRYDDCDPGNLVHVQADLCPKQRHLGVTCCYN